MTLDDFRRWFDRVRPHTLMEGCVFFLPKRWRQDATWGQYIEIRGRWFLYGVVRADRHDALWYIQILLPSYSMRRSDYDCNFRMHQLALIFTWPVLGPERAEDGWRFVDIVP